MSDTDLGEHLLLACNAGSGTLKLGVYRQREGIAQRRGRGVIDLRLPQLALDWRAVDGRERIPLHGIDATDMPALLDAAIGAIQQREGAMDIAAVGHRVVHGGLRFGAPTWLDDAVLAELDALSPLAPLHQAPALRIVRALRKVRPDLPQAAAFDTAFHRGHADHIARMAIPRELFDEGVRRYGFHGLSYQSVVEQLRRDEPDLLRRRIVVAHLGSGASLCAIRDGRSIDSSMGFSALDGIPMATRPGALDVGVPLYLLQQRGLSVDELQHWLYHQCGLLGVSGISADMRQLLDSPTPEAAQAVELFCFRTAREIAALANSLGGLDALVFTAGIGEHAPEIRAGICAWLQWLGVALDADANRENARRIDAIDSRVALRMVGTDEEQVIADALVGLTTPP